MQCADLSVSQLIAVLDHLGLDRIRFLREHLGRQDGLELDRPRGPMPDLVRAVWERFRTGEEGPGVGEKFLESLDQQRYDDPAGALQLAEGAVRLVEVTLLPKLLGVVGSALRLLLRLNDADHALQAGIRLAVLHGDRQTGALLLRRLAYVCSERAENEQALRLSEKASLAFLKVGDRPNFAKALVDQGIWLSRLDRPHESVEILLQALDFIPESDARYRCAAFQVLGLKYRELGELEKAMVYAQLAADHSLGLGQVAVAKIVWLRAQIHAALGQLTEAESQMRRVVDAVWSHHPSDAALATCELVRVMVLQGKSGEGFEIAQTMRALLEPLKANPIVSAAIADLLRSGHAGLTLAVVEAAYCSIESERQARRP